VWKIIKKLKFTLEMGSRSIPQLCTLRVRWGWVVNATSRPLHTRERDAISIVKKAR
jgi:hypothetical protein